MTEAAVERACHAGDVGAEESTAATRPSRQPIKRGGPRVGLTLARASWQVLLSDAELLWVPAIALAVSAVAVVVDVLLYGGLNEAFGGPTLIVAVKTLPLAAVIHTVAVISDAFVVAAARVRLVGGDPSFERGWRVVCRRLPTLLAYGMLRALERTFTLVLSTFKRPGQWLAGLIDAAWDVATFLAVPVILFERDQGAWRAVRRSAHLVRVRWGTQLVAQATVGLVVFMMVLAITLLAGLACALWFGSVGVWVVAIAGLAFLEVVDAALSAVLSAAMYRFLVTGETSMGFDETSLRAVFTEKDRP